MALKSAIERKTFALDVKADDAAKGVVIGYGSQFGNVDYGGDVCVKGCYAKTLAEWRAKKQWPAFRFEHDNHEPIGDWLDMSEDDYGLKAHGQIWTGDKRTDASQKAHNMAVGTGPKGFSIGYFAHKYDYNKDGHRLLLEVELVELSFVSYAMNPGAVLLSAKSGFLDEQGAPYDIRSIEKALRETCGLSSRQAKAFLAEGYAGLKGDPRDEENPEGDSTELIESLNSLLAQVKGLQ